MYPKRHIVFTSSLFSHEFYLWSIIFYHFLMQFFIYDILCLFKTLFKLINATSELDAKYDNACKELMLNKEILAPILQNVVSEFKDCTITEVIECIDAASICSVPVDDISTIAERSELSSLSGKLVIFDARFRTKKPHLSNESITVFLHVDMEVQNDYKPSNPSYPIIKRGVYYAARELSSQLGILTDNTDYNKLEKVYSIWICNDNIPKRLQNTVTEYALTRKNVIGQNDEIREEVIKMSGLGQSIAKKSLQQGIKPFVELCKEVGKTLSETVAKVVEKYGQTPEEADAIVRKYW